MHSRFIAALRSPFAIAIICLVAAAATVAVSADHAQVGQNLRPTTWGAAPPFLPPGAQIAVLFGDPTKPMDYAVRLKFPPHYVVPAHWHPTDEHVVVTSGVFVFGMGDRLDKDAPTNATLTAGGFVKADAKMNHYAFTRGEETTVVLYGMGPVEFNYVNPKDDPRKATTSK